MFARFSERKGETRMPRKLKLSSLWTRRAMLLICVLTLAASAAPLYAISLYNHPYYDDFGFSANVHSVWKETGSPGAVLAAAFESAAEVRDTWQGTYTGTFLSNLQPGVFSEDLYYIGSFILLTAFLICFWAFFSTAFGRRGLGLERFQTLALSCLALFVMLQFMPDTGEAFFWFNGGVGNVFIYSLLALAAALLIRLYQAKGKACTVGLTAALALIMLVLGGGSYPGGLFGLSALALTTLWLFSRRHDKKWYFLGLWLVFLAGFLYSMTAPGNTVRSGVIGYHSSAVKSIAQAVYYGVAQMGGYLRLPVIGLTVLLLPAFARAAKQSPWRFDHPWGVLVILCGLFCAQLTPPLYSGVFIGGGRIVNTYWLSFVALWLIFAYYLTGYAMRRLAEVKGLTAGAGEAEAPCRDFVSLRRGAALAGACLMLLGCFGYKQPEDKLYGLQNMAGVSAAISLLSGEAAQYDREMTAREALLNDPALDSVTLAPLTAVPKVLMDDLITLNAAYDVRPSLELYYGKTVTIAAEEGEP